MDGNSKANCDNFKWRDQVPAKIRRGLEWVLRTGDTHIKQYVLDALLGDSKKSILTSWQMRCVPLIVLKIVVSHYVRILDIGYRDYYLYLMIM